jgi:LacI family transcriptional regulator
MRLQVIPKPTFHAIARLAGVGTATVERVLNGRGGVRIALVEKVLAAARALDYPRRLPDLHRGILRIDVILVRPETTFYSRLSQAFARIAAGLDASVVVHRTFMDEHDAAAIAKRVADTDARRAGLILAVPDHPMIRAALTKMRAEGIPVIQIVTRSEGTDAIYVGIDNYAAGRTAAHFLSRMQPASGTIVALCHSQVYQVHRERIRGFSDYLQEKPRADLTFAAVLFGWDDADLSANTLLEALHLWPDMIGLYNAGGANASLSSVLRTHARGPEIFFVGHELTERSSASLRDGVMSVVIDQAEARQHQVDGASPGNEPIRFITVTSENL